MILADLACHYPHFCAKCARIPQAERPRPRGQAHGHTLAREDAGAPPEIILSSL
jgi:hypothetical protein